MRPIKTLILSVALLLVACQQMPTGEASTDAGASRRYLATASPTEEAVRDLLARLRGALQKDLLRQPASLEEHFGFKVQNAVDMGMRTAKAVALSDPPIYLRATFDAKNDRGPVLTISWYGWGRASIGQSEIAGILGAPARTVRGQFFHSVPLPFTDVYAVGDPTRLLEVRYTPQGVVEELRIRQIAVALTISEDR